MKLIRRAWQKWISITMMVALALAFSGCQKLAEIREQLFTRVEEVKTQINETKTSIENKVEDVKNAAKEIQEAGEEVKEAFDAVDKVTGRSEAEPR